VFPAFSSREVILGQMRKIGIHFIIYPISTEMGHLHAQHYILLDSNLRSDLERLLRQCWTFDFFAGSQRTMLVKHVFNQKNIALISVEKLSIFQLKWVIYMSKNIFCLLKLALRSRKAP